MGRLKRLVIIFFSCFLLLSCDDILEKNPSNYMTYDEAHGSIESLNALLSGIYSELQSYEYYGRNLLVIGDLLADNTQISSKNSDKFISIYNHSFNASTLEVEGVWNKCYSIINRANSIITTIENLEQYELNIEYNQIKAEALSLRALAYFDLLRLYAFPFDTKDMQNIKNENGEQHGVPIVIYDEIYDTIIMPKRSSYIEVYNHIIKDIKTSLPLFDEFKTPLRFSKEAAIALLSKVYFQKGDYSNALKYTAEIIGYNKFSLVPNIDFIKSWNSEYSSESILSVGMTSTDYNGTNSIGFLYLKTGYNDIVPTNDLISQYSSTDVRTKLFDRTNEIKKFPGRSGIIGLDNIPIIRYAEILLIFAESVLKTEHLDEIYAQEAINLILHRADPDAPPYTQKGKDLLSLIKQERRKELAFEGHRFFDLMREHLPIIRKNCISSKCEIEFPSSTCVLPIPQHEINANPKIVQNPGF
jgi:starch-binding outer membrane protein, SusD/RagB family